MKQHPEYYYVSSPDLLALKANVPQVKWSFGTNMPTVSVDEYERCPLRVELDVRRSVEGIDPKVTGKYHYFSGTFDADRLYYQRNFVGRRRLELCVEGLLGGSPKITVNRDYYRFIQHRFMNLHSVGYIMTDMIAWLLLRHGYAPLHCSAFVHGGQTVVAFAPPNTGKTLATMMSCIENGARFLAEDIAITDGVSVHAVPWTSTFRYYSRVETALWPRAVNEMTRALPVLELLHLAKSRDITKFVNESEIVPDAAVQHLIILERGEAPVSTLARDEAVRRITNLNRYEFNYLKSPTLVAYEYFNPEIDLAASYEAEKAVLTRLVDHAKSIHLVTAVDPTTYSRTILQVIS